MNRNTFWLTTILTLAALATFVLSSEPSRLIIPVFPLSIFFPIAVNKRRIAIEMGLKDALLAYIPVIGMRQLKRLYLTV